MSPDHELLDRSLTLHPQVALRPEPFGALAYHYGSRKLVFLRHPDLVHVVRCLSEHESLADALRACGVDEARWPTFERAVAALHDSGMLDERTTIAAG